MDNDGFIYEQGLEEYSKIAIILGNFAMLSLIALGTIACWLFYPLVAWIYITFSIVMLVFVLRKALCTNCYYYNKWCNMGWGKLSSLFFKKGTIEVFNKRIVQLLPPLTYALLMFTPLVLIIISIIQTYTVLKLVILILLPIVSLYSSVISRKKTCSKCKMRFYCKGSMAKE